MVKSGPLHPIPILLSPLSSQTIAWPTAAALSYWMNNEEGLIAVSDLGDGTFDVSTLETSNGVLKCHSHL